jgi:hypothetical protein
VIGSPAAEDVGVNAMRIGKTACACAALAGVIALTSLQSTVSAHHGGAVEWGTETMGPISGIATKFAFQFPHVYLSADMTEESGQVAQWTLVTRWTPTILRQHGWSRESIKAGDAITVTYLPHKETPRVGSMQSIEVNGQSLPIDFSEN